MIFLLRVSFALLIFSLFLQASCTQLPHIKPQPYEKKRSALSTQRPYIIAGKRYYPVPSAEGYQETGIASWYGKKFHGRKTSNGETYDMYAETAAHKTLPMGTVLLVKNLENGQKTVVRINDRGPFVKGRIIDLSYTAAKKIGLVQNGTAKIKITALGEATTTPPKTPSAPVRLKHQNFNKGQFYIQVGAFEHLDNARKLARKFAGLGRNVIIQQYPAAGIQLYRVMVFSGTTLAVAKRYEGYLEKNGFPNALIIAR
jgi:rare lipoprotein A